MSDEHNKRKHRKWPWILLLGFIVLVVLIRVSLMMAPVHRFVKHKLVDIANEQLVPTLSVGSLSGDLWNSVTLTDIKIRQQDSTVASVDTLYLEYHPLSYFSNALQVDEAHIINPFLSLKQQQPDSSWNVTEWVASTDTATDTTSSSLAVSIDDFSISGGSIDVQTLQIPQESSFTLTNVKFGSKLYYSADRYKATLNELSTDVIHTKLDSTLAISISGQANQKSINLQKLAFATGHTLIRASGQGNLSDSTFDAQIKSSPLGWKDLAAYASQEPPVKKNIDAKLQLTGSTRQAQITFDAAADGIQNLSINSTLLLGAKPALTSLNIGADNLNLRTFLGDTTMPSLRHLQFNMQGNMPLSEYKRGHLKGTMSAQNIRQSSYSLDKLQSHFELQKGNFHLRLEPQQNGERMVATADLSNIWSEDPAAQISLHGSNIDPSIWAQNTSLKGNLTFNAEIAGKGLYPEQKPWNYRLRINPSSIQGQKLDEGNIRGTFSQQQVTNKTRLSLGKNNLAFNAKVHNLKTIPQFSYQLELHRINLADFGGLAQYPSSINGTIKGAGHGNVLGNLNMQTSVNIDSSKFMNDKLQNLSTDISVADSVLRVNQGTLKSGIVDASISGRFHILDLQNPDNQMAFKANLKDLSPLDTLLDVQKLQVKGSVEGKIFSPQKDSLLFVGNLDLKNINYNDQYLADAIKGKSKVEISQLPHYSAKIRITKPIISSVNLQNIRLKTNGRLTKGATEGQYSIDLEGASGGNISQAGKYDIGDTTSAVTLTNFKIAGPKHELTLERPFHLKYANSAVSTDTLMISSETDSSMLELAIPHADSLRQKAYLRAKDLNLASIQQAIFDKIFFKGRLFGQASIDRSSQRFIASSNIVLADLEYQGTKLDTLQVKGNIKDDRLNGKMNIYQQGDRIAEGDLAIPFSEKNPTKLGQDFFSKPVEGHLKVHSIALSRFSDLLKNYGYTNTSGRFQISASLEGQAGEPKFDGSLSLKNAELSDIPIDSLVTSVHYDHQQSVLNMQANLTAMQQKALSVDAQIPLKIDLKTLEADLPGPKDSVSVDVEANKLNLKVFNDLMDKDLAKNLKGQLNGKVHIHGPRDNLQTSGELNLTQAAFRMVPAGIRLDHIRSTIKLQPDKIMISDLHMESGKGKLNGHGSLGLDKLVPGDLDIDIKAENFKAANTDNYNALVGFDLKASGSVYHPKLSGNVNLINGFVKLDNFGEKSVENIKLDSTVSPKKTISGYDSLALDLKVKFGRRFSIQNERYLTMKIALDGKINILKKSGKDLQIFGTLNTVDGYARPLGKEFDLKQGSLGFTGPPGNPQLNIRTLYEPPQKDQKIKIWYIIEGTVEDPKFKYDSDPPMELSSIISYTLFGQPYYKLNSSEQSVAGSKSGNIATGFAMKLLMDRVESLATRRLGIDVVKIENTRVGGKSGTSVTTGWYINPKVFFAIQNVITGTSPTTGFYLEYYLKKNLKLILSQDNESREGIDVQWEHDY